MSSVGSWGTLDVLPYRFRIPSGCDPGERDLQSLRPISSGPVIGRLFAMQRYPNNPQLEST
jgi:hypothetical protein